MKFFSDLNSAKNILQNIFWLVGDKLVRLLATLLFTIFFARYLGPSDFGLYNYTLSLVLLMSAVTGLGLSNILVRDFVIKAEKSNVILETALVLRLISGVLGIFIINIIYFFSGPAQSKTLLFFVSLILLFKSYEVVRQWFEAKVMSKYIVIVETLVLLTSVIIKLLLIYYKAPLVWFGVMLFLESLFTFLLAVYVYQKECGSRIKLKVSMKEGARLLRDSWPFIFSGLAIVVYMKLDQVMLGSMLGQQAVGYYSAAVVLSEGWYFIPMAVIASVFPSILQVKDCDQSKYYKRIELLGHLIVLINIPIILITTFFSVPIIHIIYGQDYSQSATILSLHIWASIFVFTGVIINRWLVAENLGVLSLYLTVSGAIVNVILNYFLIPYYGGIGAAIATIFAQGLPILILFPFLGKKFYRVWWSLLKSLVLFNIFSIFAKKRV